MKIREIISRIQEKKADGRNRYLGVKNLWEEKMDEKYTFADMKGFDFPSYDAYSKYMQTPYESILEKYAMYESAGSVYDKNTGNEIKIVDLVAKAPGVFRFDVNTILERISICQKLDNQPIAILDNNGNYRFADFIFNDKAFKAKVGDKLEDFDLPSVDDTNYPQETSADDWAMDDDVFRALHYNGPIEFDDASYDKYQKIMEQFPEVYKSIMAALGSQPELARNPIEMKEDVLIPRLLMVNPRLTEQEIIKLCLQYCYGLGNADELDDIGPFINEFYGVKGRQ